MITKQTIALIWLTPLLIAVTGYTAQAWYAGVKQGAENNLENLNNKTYEEYKKERSGQK